MFDFDYFEEGTANKVVRNGNLTKDEKTLIRRVVLTFEDRKERDSIKFWFDIWFESDESDESNGPPQSYCVAHQVIWDNHSYTIQFDDRKDKEKFDLMYDVSHKLWKGVEPDKIEI